jgi:hypothetical protein
MGDWLVRHVTIFGIHGQNWMLITFAIIVIWIALSWGQLAAFFISSQARDVACWHKTDMPPQSPNVRC